MELIKTKQVELLKTRKTIFPKGTTEREKSYALSVIAEAGWRITGQEFEGDEDYVLYLEQRFPVGKEIAGMLELVGQLETARAHRGPFDGAVRCCPDCKSEWGHMHGRDIKENHASNCRSNAFKEVFADD